MPSVFLKYCLLLKEKLCNLLNALFFAIILFHQKTTPSFPNHTKFAVKNVINVEFCNSIRKFHEFGGLKKQWSFRQSDLHQLNDSKKIRREKEQISNFQRSNLVTRYQRCLTKFSSIIVFNRIGILKQSFRFIGNYESAR